MIMRKPGARAAAGVGLPVARRGRVLTVVRALAAIMSSRGHGQVFAG